jgi:hypothetical protein
MVFKNTTTTSERVLRGQWTSLFPKQDKFVLSIIDIHISLTKQGPSNSNMLERGAERPRKNTEVAQSTQDRQSIALPRRSEKEKERKDPTIIRELCTPCASSPQIPHQPRPQPHTVSNLNLISSSQQPAPNSQTTPEPRVQKPPRRTQAQAAGLVLLHRNCPAICWRK